MPFFLLTSLNPLELISTAPSLTNVCGLPTSGRVPTSPVLPLHWMQHGVARKTVNQAKNMTKAIVGCLLNWPQDISVYNSQSLSRPRAPLLVHRCSLCLLSRKGVTMARSSSNHNGQALHQLGQACHILVVVITPASCATVPVSDLRRLGHYTRLIHPCILHNFVQGLGDGPLWTLLFQNYRKKETHVGYIDHRWSTSTAEVFHQTSICENPSQNSLLSPAAPASLYSTLRGCGS